MLKLPTCPHCNTIYRYGDVKKEMNKKQCVCYNCGKKFKPSKKKIYILFLIIILITAIFDVFSLYMIEGLSFIGLLVINIAAVTAGYLLMPYAVRFTTKIK